MANYQQNDRLVAPRRFYLILLGAFATLALVLAAVGIGGVMAYSVSQRSHEIGVRMALGADAADILSLVVRRSLVAVVVGLGAGVAAGLGLSRFLAGVLYGVTATDPATFVAVAALLAAVALAACWLPARRALRLDPAEVLRHE